MSTIDILFSIMVILGLILLSTIILWFICKLEGFHSELKIANQLKVLKMKKKFAGNPDFDEIAQEYFGKK